MTAAELTTTVPLFTRPPCADGWHRVSSPGGYEWWRFEGEDADNRLRFVADFIQGCIFHSAYLREYQAYRRRPTKMQPPLPRNWPCVHFTMYRNDQVLVKFATHHAPAEFVASTERPDVSIGSNRIVCLGDGSIRMILRNLSTRSSGEQWTAEFSFRPSFIHPTLERKLLGRQLERVGAGEHHWIVANPLYDVSGSLNVYDSSAPATPKVTQFSGLGCHDHNFGTRPIGSGLRRWMRGRILLNNRAIMFQMGRSASGLVRDQAWVVQADQSQMREVPIRNLQMRWSRFSAGLLKFPGSILLGDSAELFNPRVIESHSSILRLVYDAKLAGGERGTAFCEIIYLRRMGL